MISDILLLACVGAAYVVGFFVVLYAKFMLWVWVLSYFVDWVFSSEDEDAQEGPQEPLRGVEPWPR